VSASSPRVTQVTAQHVPWQVSQQLASPLWVPVLQRWFATARRVGYMSPIQPAQSLDARGGDHWRVLSIASSRRTAAQTLYQATLSAVTGAVKRSTAAGAEGTGRIQGSSAL